MRKTLTYLLLLLMPAISVAKQDKDKLKAEYYYSHYAYSEALPFLEKLSETDLVTTDIFEKLGDCYRLTGNIEGAVTAYYKAIVMGECLPATYLHYGLCLLKQSRYEEAEENFNIYGTKVPDDDRTKNLVASCGIAAEKMNSIPDGVIALAPFNSNGSEFAPTRWKNKLVFTSDSAMGLKKADDRWTGNSYCNIYSIECDGKNGYGNEISRISGPKELNIRFHTGPATFSSDGSQMYFTRTRYKGGFLASKAVSGTDSSVSLEIMIASGYDEQEKKFTQVSPFAYNSDNYSVAHPTISPGDNMLIFTSDKPGGTGSRDLYICKRNGDKRWQQPENLGSIINTKGDEAFPWWADDSTLFFASDGHAGIGGLDIFRTTYNAKTDTFSPPALMPAPLNSPYDDISLALPADASSGYFSSDRPASVGGDNIYFYKKALFFLSISVTDASSHTPVANANITCTGAGQDRQATTNTMGKWFSRLEPETAFTVKVTAADHVDTSFVIHTSIDYTRTSDTIYRTLDLQGFKIERDSLAKVKTAPARLARRQGIMDTPGIAEYQLGGEYIIGNFDFNFSRFYYSTDKADVNIDRKVVLDTLASILRRHPTMRIRIQAHSDCRGSAEYNMKLSIERARSVVAYLLDAGIEKSRLEYIGYGETRPYVPCPDCLKCSEKEHAQNRVLEFKVLRL